MSNRQKLHVTYKNGKWGVRKEGSERSIKNFETKEQAVDFGRQKGREAPLGQLIIHKKDGEIQTEHTYGKDPYPPKG